jgi:hypothetical protein
MQCTYVRRTNVSTDNIMQVGLLRALVEQCERVRLIDLKGSTLLSITVPKPIAAYL